MSSSRPMLAATLMVGCLTGIAPAQTTGSPNFVLSYVFPSDNNSVALTSGTTINFPSTSLGSSQFVTIVAMNQGTGPGNITSVAVSGAAFQANNLALVPTTISAGGIFQFAVRFSPTVTGSNSGTLQMTVDGLGTVKANLTGLGSSGLFQYQVLANGTSSPAAPGQTLAFAQTPVGNDTLVTITVTNAGSASASINSIALSGQYFVLSNLPSAFPLALAPGASTSFMIHFAPASAGTFTGVVLIGSDLFNITGTGLGATLSYTLALGSSTTTLAQGGSLIFPPTGLGSKFTGTFTIQNSGNQAGHITSIALDGGANSPFQLTGLPAFPVQVPAGASIMFSITFIPSITGILNDNLRIDTVVFSLSGNGSPPPPLPAYQFVGPTGTIGPLQQPSIGLTLVSGYPIAISGTLTLTVNSDQFATDPAVQFSSGGTTVNFTIPANATQAIFSNLSTSVFLQTGSVAETIIVTPHFSVANDINITPPAPMMLTLAVPKSSPQVLSVGVGTVGVSSFSIVINGFATGRDLNQLNFQFTAAPNSQIQSTMLTMDVQSAFSTWYRSSASQPFGSLFSATVQFNLQGVPPSGASLTDLIQSVSVTAVNAEGSSGAQSVALH